MLEDLVWLAGSPGALAVMREGSYTLPDGRQVQFTDRQTLLDAADLYAVLREQHPTGSSNLENDQVRQMLTDMLAGKPLEAPQWGALQRLQAKYASEVQALRASPDHKGQNYFPENPGSRTEAAT